MLEQHAFSVNTQCGVIPEKLPVEGGGDDH
jgi:hypothetical protein